MFSNYRLQRREIRWLYLLYDLYTIRSRSLTFSLARRRGMLLLRIRSIARNGVDGEIERIGPSPLPTDPIQRLQQLLPLCIVTCFHFRISALTIRRVISITLAIDGRRLEQRVSYNLWNEVKTTVVRPFNPGLLLLLLLKMKRLEWHYARTLQGYFTYAHAAFSHSVTLIRVGFLPWQKVFLPGQWKKPVKTAEKPAKTATYKIVQKHPNWGN